MSRVGIGTTRKVFNLAFRIPMIDEQFGQVQRLISLILRTSAMLVSLNIALAATELAHPWLRAISFIATGISIGATASSLMESTDREDFRRVNP